MRDLLNLLDGLILSEGVGLANRRPGEQFKNSVDDVITLDKFADILKPEVQNELIKRNAIFIPHRSFEVYINDYDAIYEYWCRNGRHID